MLCSSRSYFITLWQVKTDLSALGRQLLDDPLSNVVIVEGGHGRVGVGGRLGA